MMTHDEVSDLLASFALDAVDGEEHEQIIEHLNECPRCRAEIDAHREVAAALGNSVEPLPEGLWSSIASRLPERRDEEPPPMPRLRRVGVEDAPVSARLRRRQMSRGPLATVGAIAVAAAAVAAVLGINLVRANHQVTTLQTSAEAAAPAAVAAALETPGHTVVNLDNAKQKQVAQFVLVRNGRGYLVSSELPVLAKKHTYQLWGIVGGQPISLGLLGRSPYLATFTMAGTTPAKLSITVEPAGGSVVPDNPIVATGTV
jgi:anti-sigma-K factor RskA